MTSNILASLVVFLSMNKDLRVKIIIIIMLNDVF